MILCSTMAEPQVIELNTSAADIMSIDLPPVDDTPVLSAPPAIKNPSSNPSTSVSKPSVNFGSGVELLMNDKRKGEKSPQTPSGGDLSSLSDLDAQLDNSANASTKSPSKSGLFNQALQSAGMSASTGDDTVSPPEITELPVTGDFSRPNTPQIGRATAENASENNVNKNRTWDGFAPFGAVPVDPDTPAKPEPLSEEETLRQKFKVLRDLEQLEKKGISLSKRYGMDSSLQEMQGEYETIVAEREKKASAKFQGRMLMAAVTGLEFLNNRFDPFDVKLDGWAEQIGENLNDYDEIFAELHEKYKSKARMAPELKLLFQLGGSAIMVHMTNSMFKSSVPGMDDIMRQNPELMQQFSRAAMSSMSDSSPGFSNFMQDLGGMGNNNRPPPRPTTAHGPPPAAMRTQVPRSAAPRPSVRPDLQAARGGIDLADNAAPARELPRPEMRGPRDLGSILSGLKPKTINVPNRASEAPDQSSTISVQELKEMSNAKAPPRSKRRGASAKNTVSLEL